MASTVESLTAEILRGMGVSSLAEVAATLPSALTTDVNISAAEMELKAGRIEEAFHQLSLSHSTLLHHRMAQRLHKPNKNKTDDEGYDSDLNSISIDNEKITLSTSEKEDTVNLLQKLPSDWTIVQITSANVGECNLRKIGDHPPTPRLYISRCSCGPQPTIAIQTVAAPRDKGVRGILEEVELIKEENKLINRDFRKQVQKYHAKREELNNRLKCVVRSMEVAWLRHWCCLLPGGLEPRDQQLLKDTMHRILSNYKGLLTENQKLLLQYMISCPTPAEKAGSMESGSGTSLRAGIALILGESVRSQNVKDLYTAIHSEEASLEQFRKAPRNPVILIIDKSIVTLPWEMMWVMHDQPVTRMPSLRMLVLLYQHHSCRANSVLVQGVDSSKGFFLVDPDSNLPSTQERVKGPLAETGWQGITARRPTHDEFREAISANDLFVYIGHGSGSQYLPGELVERSECRALALLYGCSSVRLAPRGRIPDPWGVVLNYLIAYCPCVVGMLWDVTDKDTDNLTLEMLRALQGINGAPGSPLANPPSDIPLVVARSRSICRWYLTAAALTVYGLPLHVVNSNRE
ncbi:separin-like isoform X2 [Penaeus japonicus]|uniref:separin-like isoform X2 n=1 Tax=Penaeus japonicus TaxID=27405 RepID=UPI001C7158DF|nr:separin-like isoform X2 [Penaeus japonicus]